MFKFAGALFSIIGICSLIGVVFSIQSTNNFIKRSKITQGKIVDIITKTSRDSDGHTSTSRFPIIQFEDGNGSTVEFQASSSTPDNSIGKTVEVRYVPGESNNARISSSFMDMWGLSVFFVIFGIVFSGVGMPIFYLGIRDDLNEKRASSYSKEIRAKIKNVGINRTINVNGRSPYIIEAQWLNPDTNEVHIFKSKNLWYDPSDYLQSNEVMVKTDPKNLKRYWMDISFLPKKHKTEVLN